MVCPKWYYLGLQLKVPVRRLDTIRHVFSDPKEQFLEMLKDWLLNTYNPSWKTVVDALRSPGVEENRLASVLERKYCLVEETDVYESKH